MTRWAGLHGVAGAQRWNPKLLGTGLKLWLDADDAAKFTLNGSNVSQWDDKSGNANHASQATDANRPTRQTNVLNGRACVRFDGTNDRLTTNYSMDGVTSFATWLVMKADSAVGSQSALRQQDNGYFAHPWCGGLLGPRDPQVILSWDGGITTVNLTGALTSAAITGFVRISGTSNTTYRNGTQEATRSANTSTFFTGGAKMALGVNAPGTSEFFDGDIHEAVIYTGSLSTGDRQKLEGYLAWKWGLNGNLPSDHPYKNYAP